MVQIINLSKYYYYSLIKQKGFLLSILIFLLLAINIIPSESADYSTFRMGNYVGHANDAWVGSLGAVLSNTILVIIGFFFLDGSYQREVKSGLGQIIRSSPASNFKLLLHKWGAFTLVLSTFLLILIITLYLANISSMHKEQFSFFNFIKPFLFFSFPLVVIISIVNVFIDISFKSRVVRIITFLFLITLSYSITSPLLNPYVDITGTTEFLSGVKEHLIQIDLIDAQTNYSIGYVSKNNPLEYFDWNKTNWTANLSPKIILASILFLLLFLKSFFFGRYVNKTNISLNPKTTDNPIKKTEQTNYQWKGVQYINPQKKFIPLFLAELSLLQKYFTPIKLIIILVVWLVAFFTSYTLINRFLIPGMMLLILPLYTDFFNAPNKNSLTDLFRTSFYSETEKMSMKLGIGSLVNSILLIPIFIHQDFTQIGTTVFLFLLIGTTAYLLSRYLQSIKLFEIVYIIIFISYTNGSPIFNLY